MTLHLHNICPYKGTLHINGFFTSFTLIMSSEGEVGTRSEQSVSSSEGRECLVNSLCLYYNILSYIIFNATEVRISVSPSALEKEHTLEDTQMCRGTYTFRASSFHMIPAILLLITGGLTVKSELCSKPTCGLPTRQKLAECHIHAPL